jgi:hypothetical protein
MSVMQTNTKKLIPVDFDTPVCVTQTAAVRAQDNVFFWSHFHFNKRRVTLSIHLPGEKKSHDAHNL